MASSISDQPTQYVVRLKSASVAGRRASADNAAGMTEVALRAEHKAALTLLQSIKRRVLVLEREIKRKAYIGRDCHHASTAANPAGCGGNL
jgi:hypothetical protein